MNSDFAILILSCDKYSDLWDPFFKLFWKSWSDCPYPVYLGSNTISYKGDKRVETILSGEDKNWSSSYKTILKKIPERYIFVWVDDGFITSRIDTDKFQRSFNFLIKTHAKHIHHRPLPKPDRLHNNNYGIYDRGLPYRINVVGFWDKNYLKQLLLNGENSWNFEIMGSYRSSFDNGFYCLRKQLFSYIHLVEKGYWLSDGVNYCLKHKIKLDISSRQQLTLGYRIKSKLQSLYFDLISRISWRFRVKLMNLLRKIVISY